MAENETNIRPIVVKRPKKGGDAHHGGSWKVAYADFVTAMMAFFLLLWILETSTMETRNAIADMFQSPSVVDAAGGASLSIIDFQGAQEAPRGTGGEITRRDPQEEPSPTEESHDGQSLGDLLAALEERIQQDRQLQEFEDQVVMEIDEEGLRVHVLDHSNRPMFRENSDVLRHYARDLLEAVGGVLGRTPNRIVVAGHTEAIPYSGPRDNYNNWDLSSDRANAARRALISGGLPENRIERVTGLADTVPYDRRYPMDPVNRRISILVTPRQVELRPAPQRPTRPGGGVLEGLSREIIRDSDGGQSAPRPDSSGRIERSAPPREDANERSAPTRAPQESRSAPAGTDDLEQRLRRLLQ